MAQRLHLLIALSHAAVRFGKSVISWSDRRSGDCWVPPPKWSDVRGGDGFTVGTKLVQATSYSASTFSIVIGSMSSAGVKPNTWA
jgi:hypothetical protein